jgi:hypothetical protein
VLRDRIYIVRSTLVKVLVDLYNKHDNIVNILRSRKEWVEHTSGPRSRYNNLWMTESHNMALVELLKYEQLYKDYIECVKLYETVCEYLLMAGRYIDDFVNPYDSISS